MDGIRVERRAESNAPTLELATENGRWVVARRGGWIPGPGPGDFQHVYDRLDNALADILDYYFGDPARGGAVAIRGPGLAHVAARSRGHACARGAPTHGLKSGSVIRYALRPGASPHPSCRSCSYGAARSSSPADQYRDGVHSKFKYHATWLPNETREVGEVGHGTGGISGTGRRCAG